LATTIGCFPNGIVSFNPLKHTFPSTTYHVDPFEGICHHLLQGDGKRSTALDKRMDVCPELAFHSGKWTGYSRKQSNHSDEHLFTSDTEPKGLKNCISAGDRQRLTVTVYLLKQYQIHTNSLFTA
jgi:hypothetical protein